MVHFSQYVLKCKNLGRSLAIEIYLALRLPNRTMARLNISVMVLDHLDNR